MIKKNKKTTVVAVIEMPAHTYYKYEIKNKTLVLDRVNPIPVPYNYGFIKHTKEEDGDSADIFVVSTEPIPPKTELRVVPHALIKCKDNGVSDDKMVAFLEPTSHADMDAAVSSIVHYLTNYKAGFEVLNIKTLTPPVWDNNPMPFNQTLIGKWLRLLGIS